jgi:hypothetical protein
LELLGPCVGAGITCVLAGQVIGLHGRVPLSTPSWYILHPLGGAHQSDLRRIFEAASNSMLTVKKLTLDNQSEHLLVLQIFGTRSGCRDIDCLKHSEIVVADIFRFAQTFGRYNQVGSVWEHFSILADSGVATVT